MWKRVLFSSRGNGNLRTTAITGAVRRHHRPFSTSKSTSSSAAASMSTAVDNLVLRSLKDHYLEASKMYPPPKINPPPPFELVRGSLDKEGGSVVLRRSYRDELIDVSVMRLANFVPEAEEEDEDDDLVGINQLFLHVDVTKKSRHNEAVHFLCALYPDALGIHSVRLGPKLIQSDSLNIYQGRSFQELEQKMRDAFHMYMEERGINESLFPFLQAWLYVKDHRNLMKWFKSVGLFVSQKKTT